MPTVTSLQNLYSQPLSPITTTQDFTIPTAINTPVVVSVTSTTFLGKNGYVRVESQSGSTKWGIFKITELTPTTLSLSLDSLTHKSGTGLIPSGARVSFSYKPSDGGLPDQTGHTGKYLTTDGSTPDWDTISYADLTDKPTLGSSAALDTGVNNGVCPLNASGKVDPSYLPSYVDDVLEYVNYAGFPEIGEAGKIYIDLATNKVYRWSGSAYVEITSDPLPAQSGHTGKLLTTNGTVANWTETKTVNGQSIVGTGDITVSNTGEPVIVAGTPSQYWRGDKTWQTFPKERGIIGVTIPFPTATTKVIFNAPFAMTLLAFRGIKTVSGTLTISIRVNGVAVTGLSSINVTSSPQNITASGGNSIVAGDEITYQITAVSSAVDFSGTLTFEASF